MIDLEFKSRFKSLYLSYNLYKIHCMNLKIEQYRYIQLPMVLLSKRGDLFTREDTVLIYFNKVEMYNTYAT
jgi:hypothetical protein